ncbi:hypothetical protein ACM9HF_04090 [Colwellia sp. RE-S-Sl-9]
MFDNDFFYKSGCNELLNSLQQKNLVYNYNFLYFSNKTVVSNMIHYNHPDGWIYNDPGKNAEISLDGENCRILTSSDTTSKMTFRQNLNEFPRWQSVLNGNTVTARVVMTVSENCQVKVILSDGFTDSTRKSIKGVAGIFDVELSLNVANSAEQLYIEVQSQSASAVISISKVYANVGSVAIESLPCIVNGVIGERKQYIATENPPAEELSLCTDNLELSPNQTRLSSVLNQRFGLGQNSLSLLPDMRGYFSRSWNNGATVDTDASKRKTSGNETVIGDYVGTIETDEFLNHVHQLGYSTAQIASSSGTPGTGLNLLTTSETKQTGGSETRPKNIAELYTIKWA